MHPARQTLKNSPAIQISLAGLRVETGRPASENTLAREKKDPEKWIKNTLIHTDDIKY